VQSEIVSRRAREVGVRVALGATAQQIRRMVLGQGFRPVFQGMALGLFFGVACRFGLRAILGAPIEIFDPVAFTVVPAVLFAAAYLACLIPARRAASVDPNVALRHL
jgi:putative ABC transport system permease protein